MEHSQGMCFRWQCRSNWLRLAPTSACSLFLFPPIPRKKAHFSLMTMLIVCSFKTFSFQLLADCTVEKAKTWCWAICLPINITSPGALTRRSMGSKTSWVGWVNTLPQISEGDTKSSRDQLLAADSVTVCSEHLTRAKQKVLLSSLFPLWASEIQLHEMLQHWLASFCIDWLQSLIR